MSEVLLVHISDLHIGDDTLPLPFPNRVALPRQEGHDPRLGEHLELAFKRIRHELEVPPETPVHVVVSGDLTCRGSKADFSAAATYLRQRLLWPGYSNSFGLELGEDGLFEKPGNHDHFDGGVLLHAHNPRLPEYYPWPLDPNRPLVSSGGGFEVRLFGLDSNSGYEGRPNFSLSQSGDVHEDDLEDLEAELSTDEDDDPGHPVVRVLVVHHTLAFRRHPLGLDPRGWTALFERDFSLRPAARKRILSLCARYRVAAILTGHTHDTERRSYPVRVAGGLVWVREVRAASAIQKQPGGRLRPTGDGIGSQRRGWLVHRLSLGDDGTLYWEAWPMAASRSGFVRSERPIHHFRVP